MSQINNTTFNHNTKNVLVIIMMVGAFLGVLNQTMLATVLPKIMVDFDISSGAAQWLTTIFMLVIGIMIPTTAFLTERFGNRRLFLAALVFLIAGSLLCLAAPNFIVLLIGRAIQGAGAGILMPLIQTVLFLIFPEEKRGVAMGIFGLVIAFAPAIGPFFAGWIVNFTSWRILFTIIFAIISIDFILALFFVKNVTEKQMNKLDVTSVILSTVAFGGLLFTGSMAGEIGITHWLIVTSFIVSAIMLVLYVMRQLKMSKPVLDFRVFQEKGFTIPILLIIIMFILFLANLTILPIYMQTMLGYSPFLSGFVLLIGGTVMGGMNPVVGRIFDRYGGKMMSVISMILITISCLFYISFNASTSIWMIIIVFTVQSIGNAGIITPLTTASINALPSQLIPHGSAMNNTTRQVAAAIGTGFLVSILNIVSGDLSQTTNFAGIQATYITETAIAVIGLLLAIFYSIKPSPKRQREFRHS